MTQKKLKGALENARQAQAELEEALKLRKQAKDAAEKDVLEDGAVKRFETLFEYCWKALKAAAEYQGSEAAGPRPAIQEAIRFGWIRDPELWLLALDTRNATVHDYFDAAPKNYMGVITKFSKEAKKTLEQLVPRPGG